MRKLKCLQMPCVIVQDALDEFSERMEEFGIVESDVVSVSAYPPTLDVKLATPTGTADPKVEVAIIYWIDDT